MRSRNGSTRMTGLSAQRRSLLLALWPAAWTVGAATPPATPPAASPLPALLAQLGFGAVQPVVRSAPGGEVSVTTVQADPQGGRAGLQLVWAEIKAPRPTLDVSPVLKFGSSHDLFRDATRPGAWAVINGGFFGYDAKGQPMPLGLVVSHGQVRNRKMPWRTGGILIQDKAGQLQVVPPGALADPAAVAAAIQSKPVLVESAKLAVHSDDGERFNRSAVLLTRAGEVILVGAFQSFGRAMAMKEFAQVVAAIRTRTGAAAQVAIAMDGGPGAQLYIPALNLHFGDPGKNYVPNLVQFGP